MGRNEIIELINRRKRQILVHSFLYYQMNTSVISDYTFDMWSKELATLLQDYPEESKQTVYYEEFKEFDGSSGYDLPFYYPSVQQAGTALLNYRKKK